MKKNIYQELKESIRMMDDEVFVVAISFFSCNALKCV